MVVKMTNISISGSSSGSISGSCTSSTAISSSTRNSSCSCGRHHTKIFVSIFYQNIMSQEPSLQIHFNCLKSDYHFVSIRVICNSHSN